MNIVSISWVRNEADVIEAFVRHHCTFLDRMIIIDNRSTDNTGEILTSLRNEGLPIELRSDNSFAHLQGEALTSVLEELREDAPDFVLPLDADEFLGENAGGKMRTTLERLPSDVVSMVPWRTYVPVPEDDASELNVLRRIRHRRCTEKPQWWKVIIPSSFLKQEMKIRMGSHALVDESNDQHAKHCECKTLFLGHFPVRSAGQIAGKVFGGWLSQMANPERTRGAIFQWKAIFDKLKSGKEIDPQTLMRLAMDYGTEKQWETLPAEEKGANALGHFAGLEPENMKGAHTVTLDPIPVDFQLRYDAKRLPPLQILAESAEYLAQELACCSKKRQ